MQKAGEIGWGVLSAKVTFIKKIRDTLIDIIPVHVGLILGGEGVRIVGIETCVNVDTIIRDITVADTCNYFVGKI